MYWYHWSFWGMHFFWWLFWVALVIALFSWATPVPRRRTRFYDHPLSLLQRRYAAGEITTEEYEERKTRLARDDRDNKDVAFAPRTKPDVERSPEPHQPT